VYKRQEWNEFSQIFGENINNFLSLIKRRGFLDQIDTDNIYQEDDYSYNSVLKFLLENDPSLLNSIVKEHFSDIEIRPDGYYLRLDNLEELSEFFKTSGRNYNDSDIVKKVMGEDYWEPYSNTVYDVYDDIINELNDKNLNELSLKILEIAGNQELSLDDYQSNLFEELSDENGLFMITESNVMDIIDDSTSMNELFTDILSDLKNQLQWLGDNAYNQAYSDEVYDNIWYELSTIFEGRQDWVSKQNKDGKTIYNPYVKIRDLYGDLIKFLDEYSNYNTTFYDFYTYISMKTSWMDNFDELLSFRDPEYPDSRKVSEYINEFFIDSLHN
jgi:hypothetical protein